MIHRTRDGAAPSGGPEPGRSIAQFGNVFVEYSGSVPTQAHVDAHRTPPPTLALSADDLAEALVAKNVLTRAEVDAKKK